MNGRERAQGLRDKYGSWAVVTGASDGIGQEFARKLAEAGLNVVLVARREHLLQDLAAELVSAHGIQTRVVACDLATETSAEHVAACTKDLDVGLLVASAGFGTSGPFLDGNRREELAMIDVNCRALAAMTYDFGQRFYSKKRGGIVLMSSLVAFQGVPRAANYAATKAYVQSLAELTHPRIFRLARTA